MMASTHSNPTVHLKHAWQNTATPWGKACLVLFYSFLWSNILMAVALVIHPQSFGADCFYKELSDSTAMYLNLLMRQLNLFMVAFLLYADWGGIHVGNVGMVLVVMVIDLAMNYTSLSALEQINGGQPLCFIDDNGWQSTLVVCAIWIGLAFWCSVMEARGGNRSSAVVVGDGGTAEENQLLVR